MVRLELRSPDSKVLALPMAPPPVLILHIARQGSGLLPARREAGSQVCRVLAGLSAQAQTPCGNLVEMAERLDGEDCPSVSGA